VNKVRCFVAVTLPPEVKEDLVRVQRQLRGRGAELRWVSPAALHLTVKFLGELRPEVFEEAIRVLAPPLEEAAARLVPEGLGAFPSPSRARVLWVGLSGDVARIARAASGVDRRLAPLGVQREERPFAPHVTLARNRGTSGFPDLRPALEAERGYVGPPFWVTELVLFESRLSPEGPTYTPRGVLPFSRS
jgi:RNA 2',3'-cyclic 3'-phosphodiesterase